MARTFATIAWRGTLGLDQDWAAKLGISSREVGDMIQESAFGAAWSSIEGRSPLFARRLLRPAELPEQISIARCWLAHLREGGSGARQHVQTKLTISIPALDDACGSDPFDEESGSLVAAEGIIRWTSPMDEDNGTALSQRIGDSGGELADIVAAKVIDDF